MKYIKIGLIIILSGHLSVSCGESTAEKNSAFQTDAMMVRIAEIEIDSNYVDDYIDILKVESEASVRLEPGVICIFPMYQKGNPTQIRLLEIYANKEAYEYHLKTPHFKHYKESTLHMIKSLDLVDMESIDPDTMLEIFRKNWHQNGIKKWEY